jgi:hypothetical protein
MWQIFNNRGKWAGSCSIEPDHADLAERGEFAVRYDNTSAVLTADPETKEVTQLPSPPDAYHVWDGKTWMLTPEAAARQFTDQKAALLGQAATAAQAFVNTAADVDSVPDFELQTWPLQSAEALAWSDDPAAATPVLDTIAAARNIDRVALIKKALKKARAYRLLTAHVAGQRQAIEAAINAAANLDALDAVHIAYTLPAAPVIDTPAVQPNDERAQNSAAIEAESGSTAIESGSGSAVIGD